MLQGYRFFSGTARLNFQNLIWQIERNSCRSFFILNYILREMCSCNWINTVWNFDIWQASYQWITTFIIPVDRCICEALIADNIVRRCAYPPGGCIVCCSYSEWVQRLSLTQQSCIGECTVGCKWKFKYFSVTVCNSYIRVDSVSFMRENAIFINVTWHPIFAAADYSC
jgi:hypothetical protein